MNKKISTVLLCILVLLCSCKSENNEPISYTQITQEEALRMMEEEKDIIILDVRTSEEFNEGHIPGAINIPNEDIVDKRPQELADLEQVILIYCRSGNRSKEAAEKLVKMGYKSVYEFGGINTWPGEIIEEGVQEMILLIEVNGKVLKAVLEDNSSAKAFADKLKSEGAIEVTMHDYGNFEKVGSLPWSLPRNDKNITTSYGDVILYQGNQITIYYDQNTWSFTRLAKIKDVNQKELKETLGSGTVTIRFSIED